MRLELRTTVWPCSTMRSRPESSALRVICTSSEMMPTTKAYVKRPIKCVMLITTVALPLPCTSFFAAAKQERDECH